MEATRKLVLASRDGKTREVKEILKITPLVDAVEPPYCRTAFWHAAWKGHEAVCKLLYEKGSNINHQDFRGRSALHEAAYHGHMQIIVFLISKGANIDLQDNVGKTPLMSAIAGRRYEALKFLLENGANTNILTNSKITAYHEALFEGMPDIAELLLYNGAWNNCFNVKDKDQHFRTREQILSRREEMEKENKTEREKSQ